MATSLRVLDPKWQRSRRALKWNVPADVIPMTVAVADVDIAEPIKAALVEAVEASDVGPLTDAEELFAAFRSFAHDRWQWDPDVAKMLVGPSIDAVMSALMRVHVRPGATVVHSSPVYPPFRDITRRAGAVPLDVPLCRSGSFDLGRLARVFARPDVDAYLLCNPHNPLGIVHSRDDLGLLAECARRNGVTILSDEVHAPLTYGRTFHPILSCGPAASETAWVVTSASKGWNIAGVNCAIAVADGRYEARSVDAVRSQLRWESSRLGVVAAAAAFGRSGEWLDSFLRFLSGNRAILEREIAAMGDRVKLQEPRAGFLAWLAFDESRFGPDPATTIMAGARVALTDGRKFGPAGAGHCRLNFATGPGVLTEALQRMALLTR
ncbi:aminotransferase class I/II-fold pyridoxal phosphate-dependent enzyme [Actinoplanes sp. CA-131856]